MSRYGNTLSQIPKSIWVLGFVSLLMDISSEMIHSLLPLFRVTTLGTLRGTAYGLDNCRAGHLV